MANLDLWHAQRSAIAQLSFESLCKLHHGGAISVLTIAKVILIGKVRRACVIIRQCASDITLIILTYALVWVILDVVIFIDGL